MSAATATAAKKEMKICSPCSLETCILHYILNFFALFILPMFILSIITSINYFTQIKEQKRARERERVRVRGREKVFHQPDKYANFHFNYTFFWVLRYVDFYFHSLSLMELSLFLSRLLFLC
jgi:hypothetical protein